MKLIPEMLESSPNACVITVYLTMLTKMILNEIIYEYVSSYNSEYDNRTGFQNQLIQHKFHPKENVCKLIHISHKLIRNFKNIIHCLPMHVYKHQLYV